MLMLTQDAKLEMNRPTKTVTVEVTAEDIAAAEPCNAIFCMVALAVQRALPGVKRIRVRSHGGVRSVMVGGWDDDVPLAPLPGWVSELTYRFDLHGPDAIEPFSFDLVVPAHDPRLRDLRPRLRAHRAGPAELSHGSCPGCYPALRASFGLEPKPYPYPSVEKRAERRSLYEKEGGDLALSPAPSSTLEAA